MSEKEDKGSETFSTIIGFIVLIALGYAGYQWYQDDKKESENIRNAYNAKIEQLQSTPFHITTNINDGGELHKAVSFFSDYTTAQSENIIEKYKGEFVGAQARVNNISEKENGNFTLITTSLYGIDFSVNVHPLDNSNRQYILSLRKGSPVRFMGYISGMSLGHLKLSPGIIVPNNWVPNINFPESSSEYTNSTKDYGPGTHKENIILTDCQYDKEYKMQWIYAKTKEYNEIIFNRNIDTNTCKNYKKGKKYLITFNEWDTEGPDCPRAKLLKIEAAK